MDIRKPKPWHGVHEFLKEYVIIVVGVLTALGAEQAVEWLHWQHEAHVADAGLRIELHRNGVIAYESIAAWPCEQKRLDELSVALRRTRGNWAGQSYDDEGRKSAFLVPQRPWPASNWEQYKTNGSVQHMSDERRRLFNAAYTDVAGERIWDSERGQARAELAILTDDLPLSGVTRDRELAASERARHAGWIAERVGKRLLVLL